MLPSASLSPGALDHIAAVHTVHLLSHLHPHAYDDNRLTLAIRRCNTVALAIILRTGHLTGYRQGGDETYHGQGTSQRLPKCSPHKFFPLY